MPPIITDPANPGTTTGTSYTFKNLNAHGTHPATLINRWKLTVTTGQNNGGTLITQTAWSPASIANIQVDNLPANGSYYWGQIIYDKTSGGTWVSMSNKFQSNP